MLGKFWAQKLWCLFNNSPIDTHGSVKDIKKFLTILKKGLS